MMVIRLPDGTYHVAYLVPSERSYEQDYCKEYNCSLFDKGRGDCKAKSLPCRIVEELNGLNDCTIAFRKQEI